MLWAFRPIYLAWKNFKLPSKKKSKNVKINPTVMNYIFWIVFALGFVLFLNRTFILILPSANWKVLLDHLVGGFLVTILFYIFMLGMFSFFQPHRKIEYQIKWFILASLVSFLGSFYWEGIVQNFRDVNQIIVDYFGLLLAWIYFLIFKKMQTDKLNKLTNRIKSEGKT
jgi:membrane associated rhomboid family serine protease